MPTLKKIGGIVVAAWLFAGAHAFADPAALEQAERLYQSGDADKARQIYKAELGATAAALAPAFFHNYGLTLAKLGAHGEAYVMFLRAAFHAPFDGDTRFNLHQVEQKIPATVRAVQPVSWLPWWPDFLRLFPWELWATIGLALSALSMWLLRLQDRSISYGGGVLALVLILMGAGGWLQARTPIVGITALAKVKSGPAATFSDITTLEPGSLANLEGLRDGWLKIRFRKSEAGDETAGWVEPGNALQVEP